MWILADEYAAITDVIRDLPAEAATGADILPDLAATLASEADGLASDLHAARKSLT